MKIARSTDRLLALFPFEPAVYEGAGIPVDFVGHPLAATAATASSRREARAQLRLRLAQPVFALLPGSRGGELEHHVYPCGVAEQPVVNPDGFDRVATR